MKLSSEQLKCLGFEQFEKVNEWVTKDGDYSFNIKTNQLWFINDGIQLIEKEKYGVDSSYELIKIIISFKDLQDTLEALGYNYEEN